MLLLVVFLIAVILIGMKFNDSIDTFFDKDSTKAMRGFWCIIVILVHIPAAYTNRIQDMIGSFAYIGVTFFFMTSAYGLTLSISDKPEKIRTFWRKRLPKLLITGWFLNLLFFFVNRLVNIGDSSAIEIININKWVLWLIVCYFFFWITNIVFKSHETRQAIACSVLIIAFSLSIYIINKLQIYTKPNWVTECYGFIWGILLANILNWFYRTFSNRWIINLAVSCIAALFLGIMYLLFKPVLFWGDYLLKIVLGLGITLFILISNLKISYGNKVNSFLGEISFEIYLVHGQVFKIVDNISNSALDSGPFILLSILLTIIIAYLSHIIVSWIMKYVNKLIDITITE